METLWISGKESAFRLSATVRVTTNSFWQQTRTIAYVVIISKTRPM